MEEAFMKSLSILGGARFRSKIERMLQDQSSRNRLRAEILATYSEHDFSEKGLEQLKVALEYLASLPEIKTSSDDYWCEVVTHKYRTPWSIL